MIAGALLFLALLGAVEEVEPVRASRLGAELAGHPELAEEVVGICRVESRCRAIGIHRGHAPRRPGAAFERRAAARGYIDPEGCDAHRGGPSERWGIRGAHGHAAAYAVRHLGPCVAPEALDVPLLSAIAAARRLADLRRRYDRRTPASRAHAWRHGIGCYCGQER